MSNPQPRLGKGLEALIPKSLFSTGKTIMNIPISEIKSNPFQPRETFDSDALETLANSIKTHGLNQPILVRRIENYYELVAGERRLRACQHNGMTTIPAIIKQMTDKESMEIALIENLQRENLNAVEIAQGYRRLIQEFALTHQDLAQLFGKNRSTITNTLRLLNLPAQIQDAVKSGELSEGHARTLLALDSADDMLNYFNRIAPDRLNVRDLERQVAKHQKTRKPKKPHAFVDVQSRWSEALGVPIHISGTSRKGRIVIQFGSKDEWTAICGKLESAIHNIT